MNIISDGKETIYCILYTVYYDNILAFGLKVVLHIMYIMQH